MHAMGWIGSKWRWLDDNGDCNPRKTFVINCGMGVNFI